MSNITDRIAEKVNNQTGDQEVRDAKIGNQLPIHKSLVTLGGSPHTVTNSRVQVGDVVQVSLATDDTGSAVTAILAIAANGSITITYTGGSGDDGVVNVTAFRV